MDGAPLHCILGFSCRNGFQRLGHAPGWCGYGGALCNGFAAATKELVFYTDGDAQYDPRELTVLLDRIEGADVVNGYKIERGDRLVRKVLGRVYHATVKLLFRLPLRDVDCDFRLMRREVIESIDLESDSGVICAEMMTKICGAGFRVVQAPVHSPLSRGQALPPARRQVAILPLPAFARTGLAGCAGSFAASWCSGSS